jgi:signal transduction histidine kinase
MAFAMPLAQTVNQKLNRTVKEVINWKDRAYALEQRVAQLEAYQMMQHAVTQIIARSTDLDNAIPRIIQALCETIGWDFGEVWHLDRETNLLCCESSWHTPAYTFPSFSRSCQDTTFSFGMGLPGQVWSSGKPTWIKDVVIDKSFLRGSVAERDGLHAGLGIPVRAEGEVIGVMTFFSRHIQNADRDLLRVMETIGSQIGLFIERKRIECAEQEQARKLAALEERQRLARELHDSVTQTLFAANVIAEMLPQVWNRAPEQVAPNLDELYQLTRNALAEMRDLLVELRPATPKVQVDLNEMLNDLTDSVMKRSRLKIEVDVKDYQHLSSDAQMAFFRITQEALNNVVKHASATRVWIQLYMEQGHLQLHIRDNGRGFKMDLSREGHFGLSIMRERAEQIGASFRLNSKPGQGTHMTVIRLCESAA